MRAGLHDDVGNSATLSQNNNAIARIYILPGTRMSMREVVLSFVRGALLTESRFRICNEHHNIHNKDKGARYFWCKSTYTNCETKVQKYLLTEGAIVPLGKFPLNH